MPLLMPLIVGAVVYFLYRNGVFHGRCGPTRNKDWETKHPRESDSTPLEILKRRYAEGEISTEEYQQRKEELTEN